MPNDKQSHAEHRRIWLEPYGAPDRCWCSDNQWGEEGVEYILASVHPTSEDELVERLVAGAAALSKDRPHSSETMAAAASAIEALEAENARLLRTATDRRYMLEAYRAMLGPKALEVVASWNASNVQRVHYDWSQDALTLSGEERAQVILDWEEARKSAVLIDDVDSHLAGRSDLNPEREEK